MRIDPQGDAWRQHGILCRSNPLPRGLSHRQINWRSGRRELIGLARLVRETGRAPRRTVCGREALLSQRCVGVVYHNPKDLKREMWEAQQASRAVNTDSSVEQVGGGERDHGRDRHREGHLRVAIGARKGVEIRSW
jgi:hypothetical protein